MYLAGAATRLRPAYGGAGNGLNAMAGEGIIKHRNGVIHARYTPYFIIFPQEEPILNQSNSRLVHSEISFLETPHSICRVVSLMLQYRQKGMGLDKKSNEAVPKLQFLEQLLTRACFIEPKVRTKRVLEQAQFSGFSLFIFCFFIFFK
jgi:hypothetical protein